MPNYTLLFFMYRHVIFKECENRKYYYFITLNFLVYLHNDIYINIIIIIVFIYRFLDSTTDT